MARRQDPDKVELAGVTATPMRDRGEDQGRRYWRARTGSGKERRTIWTGWATRTEVEVVVADLVRKGIPSRPSGPAAVRTVADLLSRWRDHQEQRRKGDQIAARTLINYKQAARYWVEPIGDVAVRALTRRQVEDQLTAWLADGIAPRTVKLAVDVLAAALAWGAARDLCPKVDLARLSALRVRDDEHVGNATTPTRSQVSSVLAHLDGWYRDLLHVQALTGARIGEVAALRVGDWDPANRTLVLSGRDVERERRGKVRPRRWPAFGELAELLQRLATDRAPDDRLVAGPPREFVPQLGRALRAACDTAGVPRFTTHGIRRLVALELLDGGGDPRTVSDLTGHSVTVLLRSYVRPTPDRLRDLVTRAGLSVTRPRGKVHRLRAQKRGTPTEDEDG